MSEDHPHSLRSRLRAKAPRPLDRVIEPIASTPRTPIALTRAHEISAMAVGLLVLQHVEETGRTRLHDQAIQESLKRLTEHLNAAQMMRLEVEAYEIVNWLVCSQNDHDDMSHVATTEDGVVHYQAAASVPDIVRAAAAQNFDIKISYYSSKRMEMNTRVISPKAIAAEIYVRAWCHERKDERIFRMERIRTAVPVRGKAIGVAPKPPVEIREPTPASTQQSFDFLLDTPTQTSDKDTRSKTAKIDAAAPQNSPAQELDQLQTPLEHAFDESDSKAIVEEKRRSRKRAAPLELTPSPSDEELLAMEKEARRKAFLEEEAERQRLAAEEAALPENKDQLSFFDSTKR